MDWREIPGWPEYECSERGDIRRVKVTSKGFRGIRKPYLASTGYLYIVLRHSGRRGKAIAIHRLVAMTFIGPAPSGQHQAAHKDGNRLNCHWQNLRWATRAENEADKIAHGRTNRGERQGRSRLKEPQVRSIKARLAAGGRPAAIARDFGVARTTVSAIASGRSWAWLVAQ